MRAKAWQASRRFKPNMKKTLRRLPEAAREGAAVALATNGAEAQRIIAADAPKGDKGSIPKSVKWGRQSDPDVPKNIRRRGPPLSPLAVSVWAGGKAAPHAHLVHDGTKKRSTESGANRGVMRPQPFFWPNIISLKRRHRGRVSRAAGKAIRAEAKRRFK